MLAGAAVFRRCHKFGQKCHEQERKDLTQAIVWPRCWRIGRTDDIGLIPGQCHSQRKNILLQY